ncbi:F-box protein: endocytic membrane traffic, recycling ReCYcling 1 [Lithohypha guttulata]|uniref:F-box protein: endocytic membrane traffic, recycling ReCYcling 1 n=1 Tax=Lithohypha guttulata TaxID=1690604 RepID=UPI002DE1A718|nr:F-box protein: endocytic membrane traffic, recycling ReCYcling 1 [Lithohypha guttulata]KAK5104806.1 F-box protein: endocytic membrane traffic, recycling ReCYcling 1 [Lithohypha guttulata]
MSAMKKRAPKAPQRRDPLAELRMSNMVISKPFLPVELISQIVDHLSAVDLISVARVSRKMHEMVYDDTRWVQRLQRMGVWHDNEARRTGGAVKPTSESRRTPTIDRSLVNGKGRPQIHINGHVPTDPKLVQDRAVDGFDTVSLSSPLYDKNSPGDAMTVLKNVHSSRGQARQEYGKVHKLLYPYFRDALNATRFDRTLVVQEFSLPQHRAEMFSNIRTFAKSDVSLGASKREQKLADLISQFATAALLEFRSGYEYKDIKGRMKQYAVVMYILDGGKSGVDLFLNDNRLIANKSELGSVSDCVDYSLGSGQLSLERVQAYFDRLGDAYQREAAVIKEVFPQSTEVSLLYLEKIGEDILAPFLSALFADARTRNTSVYLRVISGSLHATSKFVQDYALPKNADELTVTRASNVLVRLFAPHLQLYLEEEMAFFRQKADSEVVRWDRDLSEQAASTESFLMSNINRQADKKDFMSSFKKVVMMPVSILPSFVSARPAIQRTDSSPGTTPRSTSPLPQSLSSSLPNKAPSDELAAKAALMTSRLDNIKSLFSIDVALNLIHAAKSSLERAAQFIALGGPPGDIAREKCSEIYLILIDTIGNKHVKTGFERAIRHLSAYNPRAQTPASTGAHQGPVVAPLTTFLELVNVGDLIQQMLDVFFEQEIVRMGIAKRDDFISPPVKEKRKFEQMLDEHVASGLSKGIDVLMDEVEYLCATEQLPTDFNPITQVFDADTINKRNSMFGIGDIDVSPTKPCLHIIDIVDKHVGMLQGSTDKSLIDVFVQEVSQRLFQTLVKHIKRQRISPLGAMRLLSDLTAYTAHISSYRNPNLTIYFNALREVSQIYLFEGRTDKEIEEMSSIITDAERYRGVFTVEEVVEFAERRSDWLAIRTKVESRVKGESCSVM